MDESQASDAQDLLFYSALQYPRLASILLEKDFYCIVEWKQNEIYTVHGAQTAQKQNFIIEMDVAEAVTHSR